MRNNAMKAVNEITSDEMKIFKFKMIVQDIQDKLGRECILFFDSCHELDDEPGITPEIILIGKEGRNDFSNTVLTRKRLWGNGMYGGSGEATIDDLIELANRNRDRFIEGNVAWRTILFSLLALAVDNDLYNEKIEIVSDAAYLMGFTEDMMEDWVNAIKKILLAEKIVSREMKTEEAKKFFQCLE